MRIAHGSRVNAWFKWLGASLLLLFTGLSVQAEDARSDLLATRAVPVLDRPNALSVVVPSRDLQDFFQYLQGRDPIEVRDFTQEGATRPVVELILLHQAMHLGGLDEPLELTAVESYKRMIVLVSQGKAALRGIGTWLEDTRAHTDKLYISEPLIRDGEFEVGFYASPDNPRVNGIKSAADFASLTAVTNRHWTVDWRTLNSLGLKHVYTNNKYQGMLRQVVAQHVDVLLSPFPPRDGMVLEFGDIRLVPIEGYKTVLRGSRHWVMSQAHARGSEVNKALSSGLTQLRSKNAVVNAYRQAGVFNTRVSDWQKVLAPVLDTVVSQ